eukprot:TRINITY_DN64988_c0_g1_i1.p1 TRINITY_DN64988_c0_g1~~TRINITY_DN64988_c0_g1_i1.p1  ORF type:complete len:699 (+),score=183.72 TRINITY_DN64988_c0_g1_i1:111-2207(+)
MPLPWCIWFGNLGDSKGVVYDNDFGVVGCTWEHKPASKTEEKRIADAGGFVHTSPIGPPRVSVEGVELRLAVSRALGDAKLKPAVCAEADVLRVDVPPDGGWLLLGCDGVWDKPQTPAAAGVMLSSLLHCHRGSVVEVRDDADDEVEDWKRGTITARSASGAWLVRPDGWPLDDSAEWVCMRRVPDSGVVRGMARSGGPDSGAPRRRVAAQALRRFVQSCVTSRDNVSAILVQLPAAGDTVSCTGSVRPTDTAGESTTPRGAEEHLPPPPPIRAVRLVPPATPAQTEVSFTDCDGHCVCFRIAQQGGALEYSLEGEWRAPFKTMRYDPGEVGIDGISWPPFFKCPELGTVVLLPGGGDALEDALSGIFYLAEAAGADCDVCAVEPPGGDSAVLVPAERPAQVGDRVVSADGSGTQSRETAARFRLTGGSRQRLDPVETGFRLQPGEEAEVAEVDADGDLRLRDAAGQLSQWTYANKYLFAAGGRPGPCLAPCAASHGVVGGVSWVAAYMQGARPRMEDAHISGVARDGTVYFGVFDGHGDSGRVARAAATGQGLKSPETGPRGFMGSLLRRVRRSSIVRSLNGTPEAAAGPNLFDIIVATPAWQRGDIEAAILSGMVETDKRLLGQLKPPPDDHGSCALAAFICRGHGYHRDPHGHGHGHSISDDDPKHDSHAHGAHRRAGGHHHHRHSHGHRGHKTH